MIYRFMVYHWFPVVQFFLGWGVPHSVFAFCGVHWISWDSWDTTWWVHWVTNLPSLPWWDTTKWSIFLFLGRWLNWRSTRCLIYVFLFCAASKRGKSLFLCRIVIRLGVGTHNFFFCNFFLLLERLDPDTSGILSTLCDHSFQCPCTSKWTYLSCQVSWFSVLIKISLYLSLLVRYISQLCAITASVVYSLLCG